MHGHTPPSVIKVTDVKKVFRTRQGIETPVLKGVSFEIEPGEFVMIQGQSGSGKSTLLNVLNGWEQPTSGTMEIEGKDVYSWSEDQRAHLRWKTVALVHQTPNWVKALTVMENVAIPYMLAGGNRSDANKRALRLLELLGFERFADYKPVDLSGGQQQRVAFLRSLINDPQIIMADEPTGNLDSQSSDIIMNLFDAINRDLGRTIIMVTHNLELLRYGHRVIRVKDGNVIGIDVNDKERTRHPRFKNVFEMVDHEIKNKEHELKESTSKPEAS